MILLDDRVGSKELLPLFAPFGLPVSITRLESGDCCWAGNGEYGDLMIGVERKRLNDLIQSMREKRLSGFQLPSMARNYGHVILIIEGIWRPSNDGGIEEITWAGKWRMISGVHYGEVSNYLRSLQTQAGIEIIQCGSKEHTVREIYHAYNWWQKKWSDHKSLKQIYAPVPESPSKKGQRVGFRLDQDNSSQQEKLARAVAAQLPGIDSKAFEVARVFGNCRKMINAGVREWLQIDGIGKLGAERIQEALGED